MEDSLKKIIQSDDMCKHQILGRMKEDCKFFLGYGERNERVLWARNVSKQIEYMRAIYGSLNVKPTFLIEEDIDRYEQEMLMAKCVGKMRNKNDEVVGYKLVFKNEDVLGVEGETLKSMIKSGNIKVVDLVLTSDNRLIDRKSRRGRTK